MDKAVLDFYLHQCDDTSSLGHFRFKKNKKIKNQPVSAPCWTNHEIGCYFFKTKNLLGLYCTGIICCHTELILGQQINLGKKILILYALVV